MLSTEATVVASRGETSGMRAARVAVLGLSGNDDSVRDQSAAYDPTVGGWVASAKFETARSRLLSISKPNFASKFSLELRIFGK